jgi:hypothetical protein
LVFLLQIWLLGFPELWGQRWFRFTILWSPIVFFWWAYLWNSKTLHAFYPRTFSFDPLLIRLDGKLFGQPSLWLAQGRRRRLADLFHFLSQPQSRDDRPGKWIMGRQGG